jgi:hypothetical protein
MTIDTRTLVAPCGIAIPLSAHRVTRAHDAAARVTAGVRRRHTTVLATNLQTGLAMNSETDPAALHVRRGTSLAAGARGIITRDDRRRTRACMSPRAQMVFDIQHGVPEYVRLLHAVSARRSHGITSTRQTTKRRSDLRRMRGDWK